MTGLFGNRALDGVTGSGGLSELSASSQNRRYNTTKKITEEYFPFALQADNKLQDSIVEFKPHLEKDTFSKSVTIFSFQTITAMPQYRNKSQEEIRWEDYKLNKCHKSYEESGSSVFKSAKMMNTKVRKPVEIRSVSMVDQDQRPTLPKISDTTFNQISNDTWSVYDQPQSSFSAFGQQYETLAHNINGEQKFGSKTSYDWGDLFSFQQSNNKLQNEGSTVIPHYAKEQKESVDARSLLYAPAGINSWSIENHIQPTAANQTSSSFRAKNTFSQELDFFRCTK